MTRIGMAALMGLMACASAEAADPFDVPVRLSSDNHLVVDTYINNEGPYPFIVDSAASGTLVFDNLSREMDLERVEDEGPVTLQASGGPISAELVELGNVRIGEGEFELPVTLSFSHGLELQEVTYGIIGADVLYRQPVGFELSRGHLHLYETGIAINPETDLEGEWFAVPISESGEERARGFYWVDISLNGVEIPALIDTGARRTTINTPGAVAAGIDPANSPLTEDTPIRSASPDAVDAWVVPTSTIQIGERVWSSRNVTLADLPIFEVFGIADMPMIVLGADILAEQNFIIDPIGNQLWVQSRRPSVLGSFFSDDAPATQQSAATD